LNGIVTHIQRYSIHDGPGIRTVVFFKGCPLTCQWCCNPETQAFQPELEFIHSLCQQCGRCILVCPESAVNPDVNCAEKDKIDRSKCTLCKKCVQECPTGALKLIGESMTVEEIYNPVQKDAAYYRRSGGGMTLSGGEPLSQPEFAYEVLKKCHDANISTAIETCGLAPKRVFEKVLPVTDLFLYDIKQTDAKKHEELTGSSNKVIWDNLQWLCQEKANVVLRLPMIPGKNMDLAGFRVLAGFVKEMDIKEVNLMPFHQMGKDKYAYLGKGYQMANQSDLRLDEEARKELIQIQKLLQSEKTKVIIGG
jgi:pyruvate formate lyase activating enzyme